MLAVRGPHIVDSLTMQSGNVISLKKDHMKFELKLTYHKK